MIEKDMEMTFEMKKKKFFEISNKISRGLKNRGIKEEDILKEFEKIR